MKLTPRKQRFVELLLQGLTKEQAAQQLKVSKTTAWRWLRSPEVQDQLRKLQDERLRAVHTQLLAAAEIAVSTLVDLCSCRSTYVRAQSARAILEMLLKTTETLELRDRIEALEEKLKALEESNNAEDKIKAA